ncbi:preprotein translocase subunit SecD [Alkalispirochaeta sphaeroplastigenens]|uniref:Protein translocase subunit SecD n=1 Tax=Alkalispirochaeta sphaeroplastigenens TaxID=1187066 RepID=A0A2S4JR19_9SPIO|nr:protein translocase subunit SecD [Alkalispirochaeta sphaeroplastigenens]POR01979.1 preprotein translocase subunit SecD [Alkalispirochaeta sphaeroplastigenens]
MSKRLRLSIILALVAFGAAAFYPTVRWYFFVPESQKQLAQSSRIEIRDWAQGRAREALEDLRGAAAAGATLPGEYSFLIPQARSAFRAMEISLPDEWGAAEVLRAFRDEAEAFEVLEQKYRREILELKDLKDRIILLGLDLSGGISVTLEADQQNLTERLGRQPSQAEMSEAVELAMEIIRNRIDRFGVTEPQIREAENNRIVIEIPGDDDRERVNAFLLGRGSLNFHIVHGEATDRLIRLQNEQPGWSPDIDGVPEFVPAGTVVREYVTRDAYGIDERVRWIVIYEDIVEHGLDGQYITDAQVARDPLTNRPTVNFVLDARGAEEFSLLTRDNVGNSMAIVMDEKVRAYARIQEEIPTGQVRITGFDQEQAANIALVLRTAALPVNLEIVNQQVVGATLGAGAIRVGLQSIALGFALIIVFMVIYYKRAGLIADVALVLNLFFILAVLSAFNLTLTLTSVAGIILTVGMAVDANVIIFERIKEEYRLGKGARSAVRGGFDKAFWTVMDANITTFIAALFLSQLGSGPIQGFAITLAVGIVSSMFTALVVTRLFFDFATDTLRRSKLSIAWRLS